MVRAQLVLLNQPPGDHRPVNSWIPREPAIKEHGASFCLFSASYTAGGFEACAVSWPPDAPVVAVRDCEALRLVLRPAAACSAKRLIASRSTLPIPISGMVSIS